MSIVVTTLWGYKNVSSSEFGGLGSEVNCPIKVNWKSATHPETANRNSKLKTGNPKLETRSQN